MTSSVVSRNRGKVAKSANNGKGPWKHGAVEVGPFTVYFAAHQKSAKNEDGKQIWIPTGELSLKIEVGDSFPKTTIGWNMDGKGPLKAIAENLDQFGEAVQTALDLWADDTAFQSASVALDAHIANPETPKPKQKTGSGKAVEVMNRMRNKSNGANEEDE